MSFLPEDIVSSDVEWEQAFWNAAEALYPERNDTDSNELSSGFSFFTPCTTMSFPPREITSFEFDSNEVSSSVAVNHSSITDPMQRRSHSAKGKHRRNRKDREWLAIDRIVKARKAAGKESEVYLDKQLIDPRKLQKNTSRPRFMQPFERYGNTPIPPVPRDFEIRTPQPQDVIPTSTQELPFTQFRSLFRQEEDLRRYPSDRSSQSSDSALHLNVATMHFQIIVPKLQALLPALVHHELTADSSEECLEVGLVSRTYFDFLSFSVANNLTGLDDLSPHRILGYLKSQTMTHIVRLMQSIKGRTGMALAEKLFTCAIEARDSSIVAIILRYNQSTKVDPNKSICKYKENRCTPIELSAALHDTETVRVLLKHGADPNKTFSNPPELRVGALGHALYWNLGDMFKVELELVQLLLEHGAYVETVHLQMSVRMQKGEVIHALFQAADLDKHESWGIHGLFGGALCHLDGEEAFAFVNMLKQIGADINAPPDKQKPTMLDIAARRGDSDMVQKLLDMGAIATDRTLSYAIQGQNREVIETFVNQGKADSLSCDSSPTTPYAEAIRIGDESLMQILEQNGSWSNIKEIRRYRAALDAASDVGNAEVVQRLLQILPELPQEYDPQGHDPKAHGFQTALGSALSTAVWENYEKIAIMLIHAGVNRVPAGSDPLLDALRNRNSQIVRALLNFERTSPLKSGAALMLAARWGDISIIEDLLVSGLEVDGNDQGETLLIHAIRKQDQQFVRFLLNAGSNVNAGCRDIWSRSRSRTPLSTAVEIQHINMVNFLLSIGADPGDSTAFLISCETGGDIHGLLLEAFLKRYPNGKRGFFDNALAYAVQRNKISILEKLRPVVALKFSGYSQYVGKLIGDRLIDSNEASLRAIQMLLDLGANPDAVVWSKGHEGRLTLLSTAIDAKNVQIVQLLLDKGAAVNFPATRGIKVTPIQMAAKIGHYELVLKLIDQGADVDAPAADVGGGTAIQLAAIGGFLGIVELLLKKGAKINRAPSILDGRTALEGAAEWGRLDMVQFLLQSEAQIDGRGRKSFLNAMKLAEENGHFVVLELLQSYSS